MSLLHLAYIIARRRIVSAWQLELVLFLGILLSVALLASSVVFSNLLAEAALRRALQEASAEEINFWVRVFNDLEDPTISNQRASLYQSGIEFVDERVTTPFRPFLENQAHILETATFFYSGHEHLELPNDAQPQQVSPQFVDGDLQHQIGGEGIAQGFLGSRPLAFNQLDVALVWGARRTRMAGSSGSLEAGVIRNV